MIDLDRDDPPDRNLFDPQESKILIRHISTAAEMEVVEDIRYSISIHHIRCPTNWNDRGVYS